jgi:hypothetical protein
MDTSDIFAAAPREGAARPTNRTVNDPCAGALV